MTNLAHPWRRSRARAPPHTLLLQMSCLRTQIYLTGEQRARLNSLRERKGRSLAELVREAIDAYLARTAPDPEEALARTFGALPDLEAASRDEWDGG